jgi:hypothetical protein
MRPSRNADGSRACFQKQRSLGQNLTKAEIDKYCICVSEKIADKTTYKQLGIEPDASALADLKQTATTDASVEFMNSVADASRVEIKDDNGALLATVDMKDTSLDFWSHFLDSHSPDCINITPTTVPTMNMMQAARLKGVPVELNMKYSPRSAIPKLTAAASFAT